MDTSAYQLQLVCVRAANVPGTATDWNNYMPELCAATVKQYSEVGKN